MRGLLLEGGGMRAGFVAGALMALIDKGLVEFNLGVAVSASVPTLAYFSSSQRKEMEMVWRNELHTPNLVCYRNILRTLFALSNKKPILDIHYLVYEVFKKKYPLNLKSLTNSNITCYFALTEVTKARPIFLTPWDEDIYTIFESALAVPICYPKPTYIHGHEYRDGGITQLLPIHFLLDKKVDQIVAVLSTPLDDPYQPLNVIEKMLLYRYVKTNKWILKKLWETSQAYRESKAILKRLGQQDPPKTFIIAPDRMPPARFLTRNREKINRTIDLGYQKVQALENKIRSFFNNSFVPSPCKGLS